jgi:hypothetical protein
VAFSYFLLLLSVRAIVMRVGFLPIRPIGNDSPTMAPGCTAWTTWQGDATTALADYAVSAPFNSYPDNGSALCQGCIYGDLSASSPEQQSPPKITVYNGHDQICPQVNGKPLYRIAIPPDRPDRRGKAPLTYQNNLSVAHDYWYTEGKLNFVTMQDEQIRTSIGSVDRALTLQLNRECGVNFEFPKKEDGTR